jgi:hypothetical protein
VGPELTEIHVGLGLTEIHVGLGPDDLSLLLLEKVSTDSKQHRMRCSSDTY